MEFIRKNTFAHFVKKYFRRKNCCVNIWNHIQLEIYVYLAKTTNSKKGIFLQGKEMKQKTIKIMWIQ